MGDIIIILIIGLFLFILSIVLLGCSYYIFYKNNQKKQSLYLPKGKITYSDLQTPARPLFSHKNRLTGKPDYIIHNRNHIIPVEYKSGNYSYPPFHHQLQLAAYCQLIEDLENIYVPYGWIIYPNGRFQIHFNDQLRNILYKTIQEIRAKKPGENIPINHNNPHKCNSCSFSSQCTKKLTK